MRRAIALLALAGCTSKTPPPDPRIEEGRALYGTYCALCHGDKGQGYLADNATAITHPEFLASASDELLRRAIVRGHPGTTMSAWGKAQGGPLADADVDRLIVFLRAQATKPAIDVTEKVTGGEALRGQGSYGAWCVGCHGAEGKGGKFTTISSPEFLAVASDGYLRHAIARGRTGTPMPAFADTLSEQTIRDLVALVRSWARPPGDTTPDLPSKDLGDPALNPKGPEAALEGDGTYVKVATVKAEIDRGARIILLDARAPGDYVQEHIAGAVSVPFYAVSEYLTQLPKEVWIVPYCACPHAASGVAADTLKKAGYTRVRVLDEGFFYWRDQGFPTHVGPKP